MSVVCFCFVDKLICVNFLDLTWKWYHIIFVTLRFSRFIHVAANGNVFPFYDYYSLLHTHCGGLTNSCENNNKNIRTTFFGHLLTDTWVFSMSWLWWTVLLWTLGCMYLFELKLSSFSDVCPGVGLLDHMVASFLAF